MPVVNLVYGDKHSLTCSLNQSEKFIFSLFIYCVISEPAERLGHHWTIRYQCID